MRSEYDFTKGVRGKYASQYKLGTNVVLNAPLRGILDAKCRTDSHPRA